MRWLWPQLAKKIIEPPVLSHPLLHALEIATDMHVHCWQTPSQRLWPQLAKKIIEPPVLSHPLLHALEIATDMHVHCWQTLSQILSEGMGNSYTIHIVGI